MFGRLTLIRQAGKWQNKGSDIMHFNFFNMLVKARTAELEHIKSYHVKSK